MCCDMMMQVPLGLTQKDHWTPERSYIYLKETALP
jgi:hypothetical protein